LLENFFVFRLTIWIMFRHPANNSLSQYRSRLLNLKLYSTLDCQADGFVFVKKKFVQFWGNNAWPTLIIFWKIHFAKWFDETFMWTEKDFVQRTLRGQRSLQYFLYFALNTLNLLYKLWIRIPAEYCFFMEHTNVVLRLINFIFFVEADFKFLSLV
jgi:hypothetical protein